jgi:hypothetical protein
VPYEKQIIPVRISRSGGKDQKKKKDQQKDQREAQIKRRPLNLHKLPTQ